MFLPRKRKNDKLPSSFFHIFNTFWFTSIVIPSFLGIGSSHIPQSKLFSLNFLVSIISLFVLQSLFRYGVISELSIFFISFFLPYVLSKTIFSYNVLSIFPLFLILVSLHLVKDLGLFKRFSLYISLFSLSYVILVLLVLFKILKGSSLFSIITLPIFSSSIRLWKRFGKEAKEAIYKNTILAYTVFGLIEATSYFL